MHVLLINVKFVGKLLTLWEIITDDILQLYLLADRFCNDTKGCNIFLYRFFTLSLYRFIVLSFFKSVWLCSQWFSPIFTISLHFPFHFLSIYLLNIVIAIRLANFSFPPNSFIGRWKIRTVVLRVENEVQFNNVRRLTFDRLHCAHISHHFVRRTSYVYVRRPICDSDRVLYRSTVER